ncbi:unnamed protein product [Cylicostephanus goldi]|uniref:Uncharacterized protein n=1 Tax=Cylicostephanus goldi TaxID=71465 RepID=A0A3P6RXF7_CYLGO|nr:unnamed protein product [Cylicostephanus goldi]
MVEAPPIENVEKLDAVLKNASKEILANLAMTSYIESWMPWLDKRFKTLAARAVEVRFGQF